MGEPSIEGVWEDYRDNLRYVLDDVSLLRDNIDAERFAISADHGNAIWEYGLYGHPGGISLPVLNEVPWCVTDATDHQTHTPPERSKTEPTQETGGILNVLGYY